MKSRIVIEAKQVQTHIDIYRNFRWTEYTPNCSICGKPMKLEWCDTITGKKRTWSCIKCSCYRITDPSLNNGEIPT